MNMVSALLFSALKIFGLTEDNSSYPKEWWMPVPPREGASWEILPQQAGPGEVVLSKRTELGILSNFAATPFEIAGERFASLEGFWQMMKYPENEADPRAVKAKEMGLVWKHTRAEVAQMVGFEARYAGDHAKEIMKKIGVNWISYAGERIDPKGEGRKKHLEWIIMATRAKIQENPKVREILARTGNLKLIPDHDQGPEVTEAYRYFDLYMDFREEIKLGKFNESQAGVVVH
jgi:predicted NAD-dependent protein-ADP-ribosyltransferase YbiA (DUF1768 family)